jgi:hypothetical protein
VSKVQHSIKTFFLKKNKISVSVLTPGVTPTSEFVCVFPLPNGDARMTQWFILLIRDRFDPFRHGFASTTV